MKGMTTCVVCGRDFPLIVEEHYIARDPQTVGVIANLASTDKAFEFDVFDCPHCGCQNVMQNRKPVFLADDVCLCDCCDEDEDDKTQTDHDGCAGCAYEDCGCEDEPCTECKHNHPDKYVPNPKGEKL